MENLRKKLTIVLQMIVEGQIVQKLYYIHLEEFLARFEKGIE